ncbi:L-threonate dehydrogenase [Methylopila henanensis]|uniref:L-threonate dehydrogenase n=1 Tax=Methylopila henanensis TaxID=873516 RepID=A0ABW4K5A7_9HYPH
MAVGLPPKTIAVIGLGSMGFGIAASLARAGHAVTGCDIDPALVARFAAEHGSGAATPLEAAKGADIVVAVVVNAAQTRAVLLGNGGALAAAKPGALAIACATMSPDDARTIAAEVARTGHLYLDAPISGGAQRAAEGALTVLASGSDAAFAAGESALAAMAATLHRLGSEPGVGAAFKMVNQLLAGVHIAAACEALTFAQRLGLDLAKVYEVITGSAGNSWMFENRGRHVVEGDYAPRSAVDIFVKDLGIVADMSRATKFPTPMAGAGLQLFLMTAAAGMGRDDDASVARLFARIAGLELPNAPD